MNFDFFTTALTRSEHPVVLIALAFAAGVLVSLSPCVYPMIPITLGVLSGREGSHASRILQASLYVLGLALTYATLGYLWAVTAGAPIFGAQMKEPFFMVPVVVGLLFVAASLFGFFEGPSRGSLISTDWIRARFPSWVGSFLLGVAAGFIESPCITPPLIALLAFVTETGKPVLGFAMFFAFALGMTFLLLLLASSFISFEMLPRSGPWLELAKKFLGYTIVFIALSFVHPFVSDAVLNGLYLGWGVLGALFIAFQWYRSQNR